MAASARDQDAITGAQSGRRPGTRWTRTSAWASRATWTTRRWACTSPAGPRWWIATAKSASVRAGASFPAGTPGRPRAQRRGLGALMDEIVNEDNTKQRQGAVGIFTGGLVDRTQALELAVIFALTRFVAPTLYTP
ncbi:MAG: DUF84 family protein [Caldilineaceae bacterium]